MPHVRSTQSSCIHVPLAKNRRRSNHDFYHRLPIPSYPKFGNPTEQASFCSFRHLSHLVALLACYAEQRPSSTYRVVDVKSHPPCSNCANDSNASSAVVGVIMAVITPHEPGRHALHSTTTRCMEQCVVQLLRLPNFSDSTCRA